MNGQQQLKQQMSQEELQRTQVLNLKDVQEAVKYEKMTSKKPALIIAILGIVSIFMGTTFGVVQNLQAKAEAEREKAVKRRETVSTEKVLSCSYTKLAEPDGTEYTIQRDFTFKDTKLTKEIKTFIISPSQGNPNGELGVQNYLLALQPYLVQMSGYELMVEKDKTTGAATTTTTINYEILDVTKVPAIHQSNFRFNVEYNKDVEQTKLENVVRTKKYIENIDGNLLGNVLNKSVE